METEFQLRLNAKDFAKTMVALCDLDDSGRELANRISLECEVIVPSFQIELLNITGGN